MGAGATPASAKVRASRTDTAGTVVKGRRASSRAAASGQVHATSDRLTQMVASSAEAALDTRAIAEKTRDD